MSNTQRHLTILASVAKLDAELNICRNELARLPAQIETIQKKIDQIRKTEQDATARFDEMAKEHRALEQGVEDNVVKVNKSKTQLMNVKTNKEYTAMLSEIDHVGKDTDEKEERLLFLMDELDKQKAQNEESLKATGAQKAEFSAQLKEFEGRSKELSDTVARLEGEKPKFLDDLETPLRRRYDRILAKLGDLAVTNVENEICQGCFTRIPPQVAVEVKKNDQMIACEACGRILVHYDV